MLNKIIQALKNNKNITAYKILESMVEDNELYFIRKNVDMDRAKSVHHYKVTVYVDFEENGIRYLGSSSTELHPTMSEQELKKAVDDTAFAARYVKNPYYPLVKSGHSYRQAPVSNLGTQTLPYWMNEITKAVYKDDKYEKGGINSCEIFLNRVYRHFINSEGIDVDNVSYDGMLEFITNWKESGEEVELYKNIKLAEFDADYLTGEVNEMIEICKDKADARNTPALGKAAVILTREAVKDFFSYYYNKSNAASVYNQSSTWKVGDKLQGEAVKGDLITMTLDPFMENSTCSEGFDEDGFPLLPVTVIDKGVLKRYSADNRYAYYLQVEPTGNIHNIKVIGGKQSVNALKKEPYLEIAAFSDFNVDVTTGDFGGEIRLAWYYDGSKTVPVTGGAITGNIDELHSELYLSNELQKLDNFEGPKAIKLLNVNVGGNE